MTVECKKIYRVAKNEYIKWIRNPKMIILLVMFIFVYDYVIVELVTAADKMREELQMFEGYIGVSNSQLLLMIIPVVFVGLMGDYPRVDGNALFYIHRVGKVNWLIGQILFSIMASATYLMSLLCFCVLTILGRCYMDNSWSHVTTRYYIFAPNDYAGTVANLTTGRLYNNIKPNVAAVNIIGLMFMFLVLISMILLVGFVCKTHVISVILTAGILCLGNVLAYIECNIRWLFPTSHSILEIHFDEIYRKPTMDIRVSYLYYAILTIILFVIALVQIDNYDFSKIQELEE